MEQICNDGIPAYRANGADVTFLNRWTFKHSTRGYDFYPVIVHINVNFAAQDDIVAVNQSIDDGLSNSPVWVVRFIYTVAGFFGKADFGVVADKITSALKQINQVSLVFLIVQCVIKDRAFF